MVFLPRTRPSPPPVKNKAWVRNPIDSFVLAKLEAQGWTSFTFGRAKPFASSIPSGRPGLPPTISEQDKFVAHPTAESLDAMVEIYCAQNLRRTLGAALARRGALRRYKRL